MNESKPTPFIKKCIDLYEDKFPEDWIETKYKWDSIGNAINASSQIHKEVTDFIKICFVNIAKSLLRGEYIVNRNMFEKTKVSFEKYWSKEHFCPPRENESQDIFQRRSGIYRLYELLDSHLNALFNTYTTFVTSVDEKLDYGKHIYLFKVETEDPQILLDFHYFLLLRKLIIPLCEIEHHLEFSDVVREQVAVFIEQLDRASQKETDADCKTVMELAMDKGRFILRKLLRPGDAFEILINCDKKVISRERIILPEHLAHYFSYYENIHENVPYNESEMNACLQRIHNKVGSFLDMVLLMDYYCSTEKSREQIDNLLGAFENTYNKLYQKEFKFKFDNHSLCTLRNFVYNCRLAFLTKQPDFTLDKLKEEMAKIEAIHSDTIVNNFYPYKKAITFIIAKIQEKVESRDLNFDYEETIALLEKYLKKFDDNIEWCELHKFYPIQLPFKECIIKNGVDYMILPSSVTRPIDYKHLKEEQSNYHTCLDNFKTSLIYLKDKKDIQSVKEEVKGIEKRYLEIGGILIGIVTFLFGTINIFTQSAISAQEMFRSILGLGMVLVLFASLWIIVIENYWNTATNKVRVGFCSVIVVVYTLLTAWLAFSSSYITSNANVNESKDSIKKESINHQVIGSPVNTNKN